MKDFYRILDLPQDASQKEIKDRYRQLVRIFHPDRYPNPEDKAYAEQKLQEINEAYETVRGGESRGLRLSADRRPPIPIVYPGQIDLGSVVQGERAFAMLQIDNVGGFAQALSFHVEDGADWFAITRGERLDPGKPLPMLLHIEARTASLQVGQELENWLDIDVNGVRARATLRMKVVDRSAAAVLPSRTVASIGVVAVLLVLAYVAWNMMGWAATDSTATTDSTLLSEAPAELNDRIDVIVQPVQATAIQTIVMNTSAKTAVGGAEPALPDGQAIDVQQSVSGVLRPVNQMSPEQDNPSEESGAEQSSPDEVETATDVVPTSVASADASIDPDAQPDSEATDRTSVAPVAAADSATVIATVVVPVVAKKPTATPASPTPLSATPMPSTPSPTPVPPTQSPTPTVSLVSTAPPVPAIQQVTISVPSAYQINARAATTIESESLALLDKGATFPAIARTIDNAWTQIILRDGRVAWVFTTSMVADLTRIETLPISVELLDVDPAGVAQPTSAAVDVVSNAEPSSNETE